jgi:hypothetical protein
MLIINLDYDEEGKASCLYPAIYCGNVVNSRVSLATPLYPPTKCPNFSMLIKKNAVLIQDFLVKFECLV